MKRQASKPQTTEAEWQLQQLDPVLGALIAKQNIMPKEPRSDFFTSLSRSIIGQQISVKAAESIFERFRAQTDLQPQRVVELSQVQIKAIGLSASKARYIQDLARHFVEDSAVFNHLESLSDEEVITELTRVKGIGIWTAQMFLMFTLMRPDVFAPDDIGLQRAMQRLYGWDELPSRSDLLSFAERWRPYRTTACFHLWHMLDNAPA